MLKAMVLAMAEKAARVDALASEIDDLKVRIPAMVISVSRRW
ncbi:hypothetical protein [Bradyrhizobium sp. 153]|nr:hypothetical protein [Bradyrhizobium sp. 153]